jgi:hypothetical protein
VVDGYEADGGGQQTASCSARVRAIPAVFVMLGGGVRRLMRAHYDYGRPAAGDVELDQGTIMCRLALGSAAPPG